MPFGDAEVEALRVVNVELAEVASVAASSTPSAIVDLPRLWAIATIALMTC